MPKNVDFLKRVYEEHHNKLRWHSDIEYRLLHMFIIINPVIITATIAIKQYITNKFTYLALVIIMASFLIVLTFFIDKKVKHEHNTYHDVAKDIVRIWEYFDLFKKNTYISNKAILTEKAKSFGDGKGYLKTLNILWAMTYTICILLIGFGLIQLVI